MSTQIAVRLPDELINFLDAEVASGAAPSRAAIVVRALEREHRRRLADQDAAIYAVQGDSDDLGEFTGTAAAESMDID